MEHWRNGQLHRKYCISTSERPPSVLQDSLGTPTGWLRITEKIGRGQPVGMVFKGRVPQGFCWSEASPEDQKKALITSRILRLSGCENGWNAGPGRDTWERYIYLHGTNRPHRIGEPQSAGCVLLKDEEMIELFDEIPEGTLVWIVDNPPTDLSA